MAGSWGLPCPPPSLTSSSAEGSRELLPAERVALLGLGSAGRGGSGAPGTTRAGAGEAGGLGRGASPRSGCFQEEEEVPLKKEKTHFTVRLTELKATDKVKLIKEVKNFVPGVNLVQVRRCCPRLGCVAPRSSSLGSLFQGSLDLCVRKHGLPVCISVQRRGEQDLVAPLSGIFPCQEQGDEGGGSEQRTQRCPCPPQLLQTRELL